VLTKERAAAMPFSVMVGATSCSGQEQGLDLGGETEVLQLPSGGWKFGHDRGCERGIAG
jgi:hypothetical protein